MGESKHTDFHLCCQGSQGKNKEESDGLDELGEHGVMGSWKLEICRTTHKGIDWDWSAIQNGMELRLGN